MNKIIISELKSNTQISGELLVKTSSTKSTRSNKPYVDMTLTDGRSNINAKIWDCDTKPEVGTVISLEAAVSEYAGSLQLTINKIVRISTDDIAAFTPTRNYDIDAAWSYIYDCCTNLSAPYHAFADELILKKRDHWYASTAALGMHHVQAGGLLQHTAETVAIAAAIYNCGFTYHTEEVPLMNADLLLLGALLHDLGKICTYTTNSAAQFEMTDEGKLNDHIVIGIKMLAESKAASEYPNIARLLTHIIASHHGSKEYGSPVVPCFAEACIVNMADGISAMMDSIVKALEEVKEPDKWTARLPGYNRDFLHPAVINEYATTDLKAYERACAAALDEVLDASIMDDAAIDDILEG